MNQAIPDRATQIVSRRSSILWLGAGGLLAVASVAGLVLGPIRIPVAAVPGIAWNALAGTAETSDLHHQVLAQLRFPRLLLGMVVGGALGLCGALTQGWFRNPLADPGLLGISSGAALGTAVGLIAGHALNLPDWGPGAFAMGFGLLASALVHGLGASGRGTGVTRLILAGIAVNALAGSAMGLLLTLADDAALRDLTFWTLGSLGGATWPLLGWVAPCLLVGMVLAMPLWRPLDALLLGEATAAHLGVDLLALRRRVVVLVSAMMGVAVCATGLIGFVGLAAPHLVRLLAGPRHRVLLPAATLVGAGLTVGADVIARTAAAPLELPLGALTTLLGGPLFLHLLRREGER